MTGATATTVRTIVTMGEADRICNAGAGPIWDGHVFEVQGELPSEDDSNPEFCILLDGEATGESIAWKDMPNTLRFAVCHVEQYPGY